VSPDEAALLRDLASGAFKLGECRGNWACRGIAFPHVLFFVAAPARPGGPAGFLLRSECRGYSGVAPTSQLWHGGNDEPLALAHRPRGGNGVLAAFSDWNPCLYHPIDRLAAAHWAADQFGEKRWTPDKTITFLLETVYGLLHCSDYTGADLPPAALDVPKAFVGGDRR
jgi:hypothetical protein